MKAFIFVLDLLWFLAHVAGLAMLALLAVCFMALPKR
jgi:hypothetical protein